MSDIISGGGISGTIPENELMTTINGGVRVVLDLETDPADRDLQAAPRQIIYLDFDGELTQYRNADLNLSIDNVQVTDSRLTRERIAGIIAGLNTAFSVYDVVFASERPKDTAYSTIFVGRTNAFDQYGSFAGLAETVDLGNRIKDDNAFVLLDAANTDSDIVSTIAHEAEHLIGTLDHGGNGLDRYAKKTVYVNEEIVPRFEFRLRIGNLSNENDEYYTMLTWGDGHTSPQAAVLEPGETIGCYYANVSISNEELSKIPNNTKCSLELVDKDLVTKHAHNSTFTITVEDKRFDKNKKGDGSDYLGCSVAAVFNALRMMGVDLDDKSYDEMIEHYKALVGEDGTGLSVEQVLKDGSLTSSDYEKKESLSVEKMREYLNEGYALILRVEKKGDDKIGHAVTIDSINADGTIKYTDSDDGKDDYSNATIQNGKIKLAGETDKDYRGYQVIVVKNAKGWSLEKLKKTEVVTQSKTYKIQFNNATVAPGASVTIDKGASISGDNTIYGGARVSVGNSVSVASGTKFGMYLASESPGRSPIIDNLNGLSGASISVRVESDQAPGQYRIAGNAGSFSRSISLDASNLCGEGDGGGASPSFTAFGTSHLGDLRPGDVIRCGTASYRLYLDSDNTLILSVNYSADTVAPTVTNVKASTTAPTNQSVTVTAVFSDNVGVASMLYRIGETGTWQNYVNGVTVSKNTTVYFKAIDTSGNESEIVSYQVTNIIGGSSAVISGVVIDGTSRKIISGQIYSDTILTNFGRLFVQDGGTANNTTIESGGSAIVSCGGMANYTIVNSGGDLTVSSGGTANYTTVNSGGALYVWRFGGTANNTVVNNFGSLCVYKGDTANSTVVNNLGSLCVYSGGTADCTTVSSGGYLCVYRGGAATDIVWTPCVGDVKAEDGACVSFASQHSGVYYGSSNQLLSNVTVIESKKISRNMSMCVMSGGTANNTTLNSGGSLQIFSGGTANKTTVNFRGLMYISSGGRAYDTTVNSGGSMFVKSLGQASDIAVRESGELHVSSGGVATLVRIENGAAAYVGISGTLNDITVAGGGSLEVLFGGALTGRMTFAEGAGVSMEEGSFLNFNISGFNPSGTALVNDLSLITGEWACTLTITDAQTNGKYVLANGADGFNRTITVQNTSGESLGTLSVGQKVKIGDADYTLNLNYGKLSVTLSGGSPAPVVDHSFFPGCFAGGNQSLLAKQTDRNVTIYADGEVFGSGLVLDPGWEIAGVGDLNGDGRDDFLRVNDEGYVVGEMSNGNGTFSPQVLNFLSAGWGILGIGDFNGNGTDDVLIANPTGASDIVGLLGYWESGVTWTLINGYSPEWECVSTGDFNGDGKCDMLWRNRFAGDDGNIYNAYCTWIVENPVDWRMVSVANPAEWNFLCSGDFDGNGSHDIAMINDVGVVGIWGVSDGYLNSWSILSAVTSEWTLAGVGDFNADGTDDIAWSNTSTGLTGYWQINNKELTTWANIATIS